MSFFFFSFPLRKKKRILRVKRGQNCNLTWWRCNGGGGRSCWVCKCPKVGNKFVMCCIEESLSWKHHGRWERTKIPFRIMTKYIYKIEKEKKQYINIALHTCLNGNKFSSGVPIFSREEQKISIITLFYFLKK